MNFLNFFTSQEPKTTLSFTYNNKSLGLYAPVVAADIDSTQGLLALGLKNGNILLANQDVDLEIPKAAEMSMEISMVKFIPATSFLWIVHGSKEIIIYDYAKQAKISTLLNLDTITAFEPVVGQGIFLGHSSGDISIYQPNATLSSKLQCFIEPNTAIICMQSCPADSNLLLVGYQHTIIVWHISDKKKLKSFSLEDATLSCLSWKPNDTNHFIACCHDQIVFWSLKDSWLSKKSKPLLQKSISTLDASLNRPITSCLWFKKENEPSDDATIAVIGGNAQKDQNQVTLLPGDNPKNRKANSATVSYPINASCASIVTLNKIPYILMFSEWNVMGLKFDDGNQLQTLSKHSEFAYQSSLAKVIGYSSGSEFLNMEMAHWASHSNVRDQQASLPLYKSVYHSSLTRKHFDILSLITNDGHIHFWDIANQKLIGALDISPNILDVSGLCFDLNQRFLIIFGGRQIMFYHFVTCNNYYVNSFFSG
jgi:hypothetical protein